MCIRDSARNASLIALDAQYMHSRAKELESKIVTEDGDAIFIDVKAYKKADRALGLRVIRRTAGRLGCSRELSGDMILRLSLIHI